MTTPARDPLPPLRAEGGCANRRPLPAGRTRAGGRWAALFLTAAAGLGAAAPPPAPAAEPDASAGWPHWRGAARDGTSAEDSGWEQGAWPPRNELWRAELGRGSSSVVVAGGNLYGTGWAGGQDRVTCLDAATGSVRWVQRHAGPEYGRHAVGDQSFFRGPLASPEFDPETGYLYTLSVDGELRCWDTRAAGKPVWHLNLYLRYGVPRRPQITQRRGTRRDYGYITAPLVHGDSVVVQAGADNPGGNLVAFDKRSGRPLWASQNRDPAGHSGGLVPMVVEGVPCVAALTGFNLLVARLDRGREGETVAEFPWRVDFLNSIPTPAVSGKSVILTARYNLMATCRVDISLRGGAREVWRSPYPSGVCSPVVAGGHLYFANKGFTCLDLRTGKRLWGGGRYGDPGSCVATADGRIITWANDGDLSLVEGAGRSPREFRLLSERKGIFRDMAWPHLALAGGRLYLKDRGGRLVCLSLDPGEKPAVAAAAPGTPAPAPAPPASAAAPNRAGGDAAAPGAPSLTADLEAWPGGAEGLVFAWKRGYGAARADGSFRRKGGRVRLEARGRAHLDRDGRMQLTGGGFYARGLARPLLEACRGTDQMTVEALITPERIDEGGPRRIVTFSRGGYQRNFTLGQEFGQFVFRLRTPSAGENGQRPEVVLGPARAGVLTHLLVTYRDGEITFYTNGKKVSSSRAVSGGFEGWEAQHVLFGDEWETPRDWSGSLDAVALFSRYLGPAEAAGRYALAVGRSAGGAGTSPAAVATAAAAAAPPAAPPPPPQPPAPAIPSPVPAAGAGPGLEPPRLTVAALPFDFIVSTAGTARVDYCAEVGLDLSAWAAAEKKAGGGGGDAFLVRELDGRGGVRTADVPAQFDPDPDPDSGSGGAGDPRPRSVGWPSGGTLTVLLAGETGAGQARRFRLETVPPRFLRERTWRPRIRVRDRVYDEGSECFQIDTLAGRWFFDKRGGGFSSLLDREGKDWIGYRPKGGSDGEYRGIPNLVHPEGYFHPGGKKCVSTLAALGPLRATVFTRSADGLWRCRWDLFPDRARLTVLRADHPYWFLYEGTPGGQLEEKGDYLGSADGRRRPAAERWTGDLAGPEWLYFGDAKAPRVLLFAHHSDDDTTVDSYWPMQGNMTVFGFGRDGLKKFLTQTPSQFTVALVESTDHEVIAAAARSALRPVQVAAAVAE